MKIKSCLLVSLVLLTGCTVNVESINSVNASSSDVPSISSSVKPFDTTPYAYEPETVVFPEDGKLDGRDWIGDTIDMTEVKNLFINSDSAVGRDFFFDREWKYNEVLTKHGVPTYASDDHKPVLEFDSLLVGDINQLPETYHLKNTNIDLPTGAYKNYINVRIGFKFKEYNSLLGYHCRANAIYYTESFPAFEGFKEECSSHIYIHTFNQMKEACETNTKEAYAELFRTRGTHVIWSCAFGMGAELLYEAKSNDYNLKELATSEVKDLFDSAVLSGVNSKTVGELEEKRDFDLNKYLNVEKGKYVFENGISSTLYGGSASIPSLSLSGFSESVTALSTTKVTDVKRSAFLTPREVYPIWEFLPTSMSEEKTLLENAYKEYAADKAAYYESQYNA